MQAAALPLPLRIVFASLWQAACRRLHSATGSQVSPRSTTPLPHLGVQSLSLVALQADGQHPSPFAQAVCMAAFRQAA